MRTKPEMGGFEDRLSPSESYRLLVEQNLEEASAAREKAFEAYKAELRAGYERQAAWGKEAGSALFRVEDKAGLRQALSADEETLGGMLAYAKAAGDKDYGRCALCRR